MQVPPNVRKMSILTYNQANSVITKNAIILNITQRGRAHKTSLTPPIFIEGTVISQESER
jgi:hypothetical protein